MRKGLLSIILMSSFGATSAQALSGVGKMVVPKFQGAPECKGRPEFLAESPTEIVGTIDNLPQMGLLIARDVEYFIEGKSEDGTPVRIHAYQSFLKADAKIICGKSSKTLEERFSLFAPTLIDTSVHRKIGNSVWQFQIFADGENFAAWNIKSPVSDSTGRLDKILNKVGSKYKIYQTGHDEYELIITQESKGIIQHLSIRDDAVANVKEPKK